MRNVFPVKYYKDEGFVEHKIEIPGCRVSARDTRRCVLRCGDSPSADNLF